MERKKRYDIAALPPILERALRMVCLKAAASAGAGGWTRDCPWSWGRAGTEAAGGSGVDAAGFCCARSQGAPLGKPWTMEYVVGGAGEVVVWVSPGLERPGLPGLLSDQRRRAKEREVGVPSGARLGPFLPSRGC